MQRSCLFCTEKATFLSSTNLSSLIGNWYLNHWFWFGKRKSKICWRVWFEQPAELTNVVTSPKQTTSSRQLHKPCLEHWGLQHQLFSFIDQEGSFLLLQHQSPDEPRSLPWIYHNKKICRSISNTCAKNGTNAHAWPGVISSERRTGGEGLSKKWKQRSNNWLNPGLNPDVQWFPASTWWYVFFFCLNRINIQL